MRTLQIHVTRRCNLECRHCYTASGPSARETLDAALLREAITDAGALGYRLITLSGGEPFLYAPMAVLFSHVKALGLSASVVTNGMFLDERRLAPLMGVLDLCVISLDGAPERHNAMRANPRAFETMADKLGALRASGIPFGFLFTLSAENVDEIDWAADFAAAEGAAMLQIHPLDIAGRAEGDAALEAAEPDSDIGMAAAERAAAAMRRYWGRLRVVVDFKPRLPEHGAAPRASCGREPGFSDIANPLCIETDGTIVPMGHGFARQFAVGRLGAGRLSAMAKRWMEDGRGAAYRALVEDARARADAPDAPLLANMAKDIRHASHAAGAHAAA
jgi:MoaA/NifB/PqqE/SkfB family radical SAM enzyme